MASGTASPERTATLQCSEQTCSVSPSSVLFAVEYQSSASTSSQTFKPGPCFVNKIVYRLSPRELMRNLWSTSTFTIFSDGMSIFFKDLKKKPQSESSRSICNVCAGLRSHISSIPAHVTVSKPTDPQYSLEGNSGDTSSRKSGICRCSDCSFTHKTRPVCGSKALFQATSDVMSKDSMAALCHYETFICVGEKL
jgi:hypothetical protein